MENYLDNILDVDNFVRDAATATWRKNMGIQIVQFLLIGVSLVDFTIYTLNFLYGLILAFRNLKGAEKLMTLFVAVLFLAARFLYVPFLLILVPLDNFPMFPKVIYHITLFGLAFLYVSLLVLPLFFAIWFAVKYRIWRNADRNDVKTIRRAKRRIKKRIRKNRIANMIIVMPIYNEEPEALVTAVQSIVDCVYPSYAIAVYLSFDSDEHSDLFIHLMKFLTNSDQKLFGTKKRFHVAYHGINFIINLFPHGGKRVTQAKTFQEISNTYRGREKGTFVMFIDSDIILHGDCMLEFLRALEKNKQLVGMTGFISAMYHYIM
jgi:chitin synthase